MSTEALDVKQTTNEDVAEDNKHAEDPPKKSADLQATSPSSTTSTRKSQQLLEELKLQLLSCE